MPRRIEIELTSSRDDGTWTWRAAGAREPRGTLDAGLLPAGAKVGDVLRADAEFYLDGIEVTAVLPPKQARPEPDRIELLGAPSPDEPAVTTSLAPKQGRGDRRDRPERARGRQRGERGEREHRPRPRRGEREPAEPGAAGGDARPRRQRPEPPPMPAVERPKAKRLRPGRAHRKALLESLPEEQRPVVEQLFAGGLPAVRQAIEKQNTERRAAGEKPIQGQPLLDLAERLVHKVRLAEWRDRAEAALRDVEHLDLRDLRSVVSAADAAARDDEARQLASTLREALAKRVEQEHTAWLAELSATLDVGRVVRALRVSSRPPKAGAPLPPDIARRLIDATSASLTAEASPERWVAVLDALALAPVRDRVIPVSLPGEVHPDVRSTIARLATRLPKIAHIFSIAPDPGAPRPADRRKPDGKVRKRSGGRPSRRQGPDPAGPGTSTAAPSRSDPVTGTARPHPPEEPRRDPPNGAGERPTAVMSGDAGNEREAEGPGQSPGAD